MKTSLEIINKLSEKEAVKLESQLVELADFKADFERYLKMLQNLETEVFKNENTMNQLRKTYNAEMVKVFKQSKEAVSTYKMIKSTVGKQLQIIEKQAKEIGIPIEQVPTYKIAQQILDTSKYKYLGIYDKLQQAQF
jgi:hypothetical protein